MEMTVDLPPPDLPTNAHTEPPGTTRLKPCSTSLSGRIW
eukprot:CAMPEP_0171897838 /NCGR_PEP_ID=MMETSP0992-20121227/48379_1 /TAXON_ID=483369 /ORGANISM="non described non described, Strain CCMP2098" /LENGTH=38 /DNA_ID= /DNA_START= /DNA_END= /DNA_ORIENTATION=